MLVLLMVVTGAASTTTRGWGDHAAPFSFLFGNHIDTHQETRLFTNGKNAGNLKGWLYVFDSGERLADGTPVLRHCTSPEHYAAGCVAGWRVEAVPCIDEVNGCRATFLYHDDDHPIWLFGARVDMQGNLRGSRTQLVQPGSYSHFHWLTENLEGFPSSLADVEATLGVDITVPAECNVATAEQLTAGVVCPGYFLQLTVDEPFGLSRWAFHHGGENLLVQHGVDTMTHLNLLTSYRSLPPGVLPGNYVEP
jgi:hypothetical protein